MPRPFPFGFVSVRVSSVQRSPINPCERRQRLDCSPLRCVPRVSGSLSAREAQPFAVTSLTPPPRPAARRAPREAPSPQTTSIAAAVECAERRAVADGDDRRALEPLLQQPVQRRLGGLIERSGRLVEEQIIGLLQAARGRCRAVAARPATACGSSALPRRAARSIRASPTAASTSAMRASSNVPARAG